MKFTNKYAVFIFGSIFGSWVTLFLLRFMIRQEFSGLEAVGNNSYMNLKMELLDVLGMFPLIVLAPISIFFGLFFLLLFFLNRKKQPANV